MNVVITGGGLAAQRAAEALRRRGHDGRLTMVCAEPHLPYDRPPLSKELLGGQREPADVTFRDEDWYREHDVELLLGTRATGIDAHGRRLFTDTGELRYDRLLVATGAAPRTLPPLLGYANVHVLRDLRDALALRAALGEGARLVVVGAGFIGLEVASTARALGAEVTLIEAASTPLAAVLGSTVGAWFAALHRRNGVDVVCGTSVRRVHGQSCVTGLELADGRHVRADAVLVAIGAAPDTAWLAAAGLPDDGVPVGPCGNSAAPGVYAAGDAARPVDPYTGALTRQEHWESAARGGTQAALGMLGRAARPEPPSSFWSDQHGVRVQLVGHPAAGDLPHIEGDPDAADFAAVWHRDGRPAAVFLAGRPHQLADARRLVAGEPPHERNAA